MKKAMRGFYNCTDKELSSVWASENTLFVFDTNTLLNLYGYAEKTRSDFFLILEKIKNRVWIPYHVALEYQRRRIGVIKDEKHIFSEIDENLKKIESVFDKEFKQLSLDKRNPSLAKSTEDLKSEITKLLKKYKMDVEKLDKKQPHVNGSDSIRDKLDILFCDRVGFKPESQEWLESIYSQGKIRYEKKCPPGYNDTSKAKSEPEFMYAGLRYERQYGDLILWKQLITKASDENIKFVVFVTDDSKDDWWRIEESRGSKTIGPRPELVEEICSESNVDCFLMYKTSNFLSDASKKLKLSIDDNSIEEARTVSNLGKLLIDSSPVDRVNYSGSFSAYLKNRQEFEKQYKHLIENISCNLDENFIDNYIKNNSGKNDWYSIAIKLVNEYKENQELQKLIKAENDNSIKDKDNDE